MNLHGSACNKVIILQANSIYRYEKTRKNLQVSCTHHIKTYPIKRSPQSRNKNKCSRQVFSIETTNISQAKPSLQAEKPASIQSSQKIANIDISTTSSRHTRSSEKIDAKHYEGRNKKTEIPSRSKNRNV